VNLLQQIISIQGIYQILDVLGVGTFTDHNYVTLIRKFQWNYFRKVFLKAKNIKSLAKLSLIYILIPFCIKHKTLPKLTSS